MRPAATHPDRAGKNRASGRRLVVGAVGVALVAGIGVRALGATDVGTTPTQTAAHVAKSSQEEFAGPSRVVAGVPVGFAHTETGAIAAASAFLTTAQTLIELNDPVAAEAAVRVMATEASADEQVAFALDDLRLLDDFLRGGVGPIVLHQAAIAARVEHFDTERARIAVWSVSVLSREGSAEPQAGWHVTTFDLVWERGDWRMEPETTVPGPAPAIDGESIPATSAQLAASLVGFEPLVATPPPVGGSRQ